MLIQGIDFYSNKSLKVTDTIPIRTTKLAYVYKSFETLKYAQDGNPTLELHQTQQLPNKAQVLNANDYAQQNSANRTYRPADYPGQVFTKFDFNRQTDAQYDKDIDLLDLITNGVFFSILVVVIIWLVLL